MNGGLVMIMSGFPRRSETFALNELAALEARGALAAIFATKPGDGTAPHPDSEPVLRRIRWLPEGSVEEQAETVARTLAGRPLTGVHGYFAHEPAAVARAAAGRLGVPFGFSVHARDARKVPAAELAARSRAAACVIACNPDIADEVHRAGGRAEVLPHGVDLARFRPAPPPSAPPISLLAVGRLVPKKGFEILLSALEQVDFPFRLRVVGDGPLRHRLAALGSSHGLRGRVELCGGKTHAELPREYATSSAVVVPSVTDEMGDRDGLPNVVLEAMASARPVVASDVGAIASAVVDGDTGLLVPAGDAAAFARALERLAGDETLRERLAGAGRRRAERDYDLIRCTERLHRRLEQAYA